MAAAQMLRIIIIILFKFSVSGMPLSVITVDRRWITADRQVQVGNSTNDRRN